MANEPILQPGGDGTQTKAATEEQRLSLQARATQEPKQTGSRVFSWLVQTGGVLPAWWSKTRDRELRKRWRECDFVAGAFYTIAAKLSSIPFRIEPRDSSVRQQWKLAQEYEQRIMEGSEYGSGWTDFWTRFLLDLWATDNGAFAEVIGAGSPTGPIKGMPVGLANLDSWRCQRTGSPEFPVLYEDTDGKKYKLHRSRVLYTSQLPSPDAEMYGVGFSWMSRCASIAQGLTDILRYKEEKLGSRPERVILVGRGIDGDLVSEAFLMARESSDNAGLTRLARIPYIGDPNRTDIGIDKVDLASLPDGFEWKDELTLAMYTISLAGGFPARLLWPATVVGATKADALLQHSAGAMAGIGLTLALIGRLLGGSPRGDSHREGKFLPPSLKIEFDEQDDELDRIKAELQNLRSERHERDLRDAAVTVRVVRQQQLTDGDITKAQFEEMELQDGRTADGLPVEALFFTGNDWLDDINPYSYDAAAVQLRLQEATQASVQESDPDRRKEAQQAVAALRELLEVSVDSAPAEPPPEPAEAEAEDDESLKAKAQRLTPQERELAGVLGEGFDEFAEEALDAIEEEQEPDYDRLRTLLLAALIPFLVRTAIGHVRALEDEYVVGFDPAEVQILAAQWAQAYSYDLVEGLLDTTRRAVQSAMSQYLSTPGMTREQLVSLLEPAFGRLRAEAIAVTETTRALAQGVLEYRDLMQEKYGVSLSLVWATSEDELVCEHICKPLNNQPEEVWRADYPDGPPAHVRCRCGLRMEIAGA